MAECDDLIEATIETERLDGLGECVEIGVIDGPYEGVIGQRHHLVHLCGSSRDMETLWFAIEAKFRDQSMSSTGTSDSSGRSICALASTLGRCAS